MALDADYIQAQYAKGRRLTAIDLRSAEEYRQGHLPGARSLPLDQLTTRFEEVPRTDLVVLYCDCPRSVVEVAYWFLRQKQYRNISVLEPGFAAWAERGHPIEK
jgi:rhodanese-related sulfurtransferase